MEFKFIFGFVSAIMAIVAYSGYIRDVVIGKAKPHVYSWLVWALATGISALLQWYGGAGVGAWATIAVAVLCSIIFIISLKDGKQLIATYDIIFLLAAIASLCLWLITDKPFLSAILLSLTNIFGFIPTIKKIWIDPYSETLFMYNLNSVRHFLSICALSQFNFLTLFYPTSFLLANIVFITILLCKRYSSKYSKR